MRISGLGEPSISTSISTNLRHRKSTKLFSEIYGF